MREVASRSMRRPSSREADRRTLRHQHATLDRVIEFADVSGPRMIEQCLQSRRFERGDVLPIALRVLAQEVRGQRRDVLAPLAKRRQSNLDRVQAEEQVLPEPAGGHFFAEVRVGGRDDADIGLTGARRADPLEVAGLEDAEQFGLQIDRDVRDFVEEQGAAVSQLEPSDPIASSRR